MDVAIGLEHLVLAATNFSLGTCWIARINTDQTKEVLGIPEHIMVFAATPLGYPDETPGPKERKALSEIIHYDRF